MPDERQMFERMNAAPPTVGGVEMPRKQESAAERSAEQVSQRAAPRATHRVPVQVTQKNDGQAAAAATPKSDTLRSIESVMEERLAEAYKQMTPELRHAFKKQGEETAKQIETMLYKVKVHTKKIFQLLFSWLKIIPGVNQFFLEQEAKLKTDEIMRIKEELDKQRGLKSA
mgnify:CR=1 FL=1